MPARPPATRLARSPLPHVHLRQIETRLQQVEQGELSSKDSAVLERDARIDELTRALGEAQALASEMEKSAAESETRAQGEADAAQQLRDKLSAEADGASRLCKELEAARGEVARLRAEDAEMEETREQIVGEVACKDAEIAALRERAAVTEAEAAHGRAEADRLQVTSRNFIFHGYNPVRCRPVAPCRPPLRSSSQRAPRWRRIWSSARPSSCRSTMRSSNVCR